MRGGGDERAGFRDVLDAPRAHLATRTHHAVATGEQAPGGFGVLRRDFRLVGLARAAGEIVGDVDKMMPLRKTRDLFVAQRFDRRAR